MKTRRIAIIAAAVIAAGLIMTSVLYVHDGYVGVLEAADGPRLLDRGFHLRRPLEPVIYYPIRYREIHLTTLDEGVHGRIEFDVVLLLSVCRDSVLHLHETFGGAYMERLVSPLVIDHFLIAGGGSRDWGDGVGSEKAAEGIVERISAEATPHGVNIMGARIRSYDVRLAE